MKITKEEKGHNCSGGRYNLLIKIRYHKDKVQINRLTQSRSKFLKTRVVRQRDSTNKIREIVSQKGKSEVSQRKND